MSEAKHRVEDRFPAIQSIGDRCCKSIECGERALHSRKSGESYWRPVYKVIRNEGEIVQPGMRRSWTRDFLSAFGTRIFPLGQLLSAQSRLLTYLAALLDTSIKNRNRLTAASAAGGGELWLWDFAG